MPNTLAHIGVQMVATRAIVRTADAKWIFLGAVVPDVPWILRRLVRMLPLDLPPLELRLYAMVQAALVCCLVLAAALAVFSHRPWRVFIILAMGAAMHLLLDATQTKWDNGVILLAPFSWELTNFGLYWPESAPTITLTALGLAAVLYTWRKSAAAEDDLAWPRGPRLVLFAAAALAYVTLPLALLDDAAAANHTTKVLRDIAARPGQAVEFDRRPYLDRADGDVLMAFNGEALAIANGPLARSTTVSVRAVFVDARTIRIEELHEHRATARDAASYLGLALVLAVWLRALLPALLRRR